MTHNNLTKIGILMHMTMDLNIKNDILRTMSASNYIYTYTYLSGLITVTGTLNNGPFSIHSTS